MSKVAIVRLVGRGFVPTTDDDHKALVSGRDDDGFIAVIVRPSKGRSLRQLRLWWSMCATIAEAVGEDERGNVLTRENVSDIIKIKTGHCSIVQIDGELHRIPETIAMDRLPQDEFNRVMTEATRLVCERWLPHMSPGKLRTQLEQMLIGGR